MKKEILRLEQIFIPSYLFGLNMAIYEGEIDALLSIDYFGLDYILEIIQNNLPLHYGRVFYCEKKVNDQNTITKASNKITVLSEKTSLAGQLTIAENLFVVRSGLQKIFVPYKKINEQTKRILGELGFHVDSTRYADTLTLCEKWIVELGKAIVSGVKLVILRNISNFVTTSEFSRIISIVKQMKKRGISFLYVCNHHQEAFQFCDRCFLLQRGRIVKTLEKEQMTDEVLYHFHFTFDDWVHSKNRKNLFLPELQKKEEIFFCDMHGISFSLKKGETTVILDNDSLIINTLIDAFQNGVITPEVKIQINGSAWKFASTEICFIPFAPTKISLYPQLSVLDNICFHLDKKVRSLWLTNKHKNAIAQDLYHVFGDAIYAQDLFGLDENILYDIVYHRVLLQNPPFVCVVQPLATIDMPMRLKLISYFDKLRERGTTVCILAYTLSDTLEIADRLLVVKHGKIQGEYEREDFPTYPGISGSRPQKT